MKKKILTLNGSPFKNGKTAKLAKIVLENVDKAIYETELIHVNDMNITPCRGCESCRKTGECVIKDDMQALYQKFDEMDVLILATPVYWSNMSGQLKILFDRSVHKFEDFSQGGIPKKLQKGKRAVVITVCNAPWITGITRRQYILANKSINVVLREGGIKCVAKITHMGSMKTIGKYVPLKPHVVKKAKKVGKNL